MHTIATMLHVPDVIAGGLASGIYERVGGVVRTTDTKQVIAWLREGNPVNQAHMMLSPVLSTGASLLTLGLSVATFAIMTHRLNAIDERLKQVQRAFASVGRDINLLMDANYRAGLDAAMNAMTMVNPQHRHTSAFMAVNRLLEAQHHFLARVEEQLTLNSQVADEYLLLLCMSYVAEARCYLELEERERAHQRLTMAADMVRPYVQRYLTNLLTADPAVYLQPALKEHVSLERLTAVYRWSDPSATVSTVFEQLREQMYQFSPDSKGWIDALPPSIWDASLQVQPKAQKNFALRQIHKLKEAIVVGDELRGLVCGQLLASMEAMESMIETYARFTGYRDEVGAMLEAQLSFQEWTHLQTVAALPEHSDGGAYVVLPSSALQLQAGTPVTG